MGAAAIIPAAGAVLGGLLSGKGSGGSSSISYTSSPEQRALMQLLMPMFQGIYSPQVPVDSETAASQLTPEQIWQGQTVNWKNLHNKAGGDDQLTGTQLAEIAGVPYGTPWFNFPVMTQAEFNAQGADKFPDAVEQEIIPAPSAPAPTTQTDTSLVGQSGLWDIPNISSMIPQQGWYTNLDPSIRAGILEPYVDASRQLTESLGYSAGTAQTGPSGALGAAQGKFWSNAANQIGPTAWGYASPAMNAGWQTELQRSMFPYTLMSNLFGQTQATPVVSPDTGFNTQAALGGALAGGLGAQKLFGGSPAQQDVNIYNQYPYSTYGATPGYGGINNTGFYEGYW